ncbi:MAG: NAD(P)H-dependent glycerol-3-phosphate dehydrogenase [Candidatus Babeliales bacterium]
MIAVLGAGAWGTAIAHLLATNGHSVRLWCFEPEVADMINQTRNNARYMPNIVLPNAIHATASLAEALQGAAIAFQAIPVAHMRSVLSSVRPVGLKSIVNLSKGIEIGTALLPLDIIRDVWGDDVPGVVVSGPSYARELMHKQMTGFVVAAHESAVAQQVAALLTNTYCVADISTDIHGIQLVGAYKNVIAILIGALQGIGCGDNAQALLFVRALAELKNLIRQYHGDEQSVYSLAGIGDSVLSAFGGLSKNKACGQLIGTGESLESIEQKLGRLPEGINTLRALEPQVTRHWQQFPLTHILIRIVSGQEKAHALLYSIK